MHRLFGLDESRQVRDLELVLNRSWPTLLILALILAAVVYAVILYRRERRLAMHWRVAATAFRAIVLSALIVALFEPRLGLESLVDARRTVLVLLDTSESMTVQDDRQSETALRDAAAALGTVPLEGPSAALPEAARLEAAKARRIDLAKGLLTRREQNVFQDLADDYTVRYYGFGERLEPTRGKGETVPEALVAAEADGKASRLGTALSEAVDRSAGEVVSGVIVLTDGAANDEPIGPLEVAERLGERGVPLFPVGLGLPDPPDVKVAGVIAADTLFYQDRVPVRVEIRSTGYANRTVDLTVSLGGREVATKSVLLEDGSRFEEIVFTPDRAADTEDLEVSVSTLPGEVADANNAARKTVRVIDEKIRVLYVEGKPRWEYRYLRQVLLRDPRLDVKFLMTEGDRDQALASDRYLVDFPETGDRAFRFDLVIVGDVPASYFSVVQLERIEELVKEHGGSFLMLAGHRFAPMTYAGTPAEALLPVRLGSRDWRRIDDDAHPVVASGAVDSAVMTLEVPAVRNHQLWSLVHPLYGAAALDGAKPGATVLATLSRGGTAGEPYPLIAWHRYGVGKAMYVGTDQLWRLRFKQGDKYHARFWGQAITFLTLSRLLGENRRVQIRTDAQDYRTGERVQVSANVLDEVFDPVRAPAYTVHLEREDAPGETQEAVLQPVPDIPGLYQGFFRPEEAGRYVVRAPVGDRGAAGEAAFQVTAVEVERLERAMQETLLRQVAEASGGEFLGVRDLPDLVERLTGADRTTIERTEQPLWDLPVVFLALVALMGGEWLLRRWNDLP
jgi:hypothetical protein